MSFVWNFELVVLLFVGTFDVLAVVFVAVVDVVAPFWQFERFVLFEAALERLLEVADVH